ncbi:hypothetical protein A1Q2_02721 [Trichosporon asahii var. asahii CBS 8904]|uniref:Uncharacterized protein n=2 Tax=Trichosporon asahii var. asahii TaxID=189963 RepID=K1WPL5_TRIAC|nr:hypothetical protein A1Q1_07238 [Trichosporon asahii var. asahii CBS 2479]EJT51476.1 hypothetical protein A1Q1_07238 [Trichosporon asahii var. asahii CBS 2479]EKD03004.1 hypothetical protein A1Q2_02721 [Trichosporon asahii var. asahii CBS 8904]
MSSTLVASTVMSQVTDAAATPTQEPSKTTVHDKGYQTENGKKTATTTIPATKETITSTEGFGYKYNSGLIVRVAIAAGIIVMAVLVIILFLKRLRRETILSAQLEEEEKKRGFESAAWSDTPGQAPVFPNAATEKRPWWKRKKAKGLRGRGQMNAYAVYEWEGVPA